MRLSISHRTVYSYDAPVEYALQQLRLTPKSTGGQRVLNWHTSVTGGRREVSFEDHHANTVELVSVEPGATEIAILSKGELEIENRHGVHGPHAGFMPLWLFERPTRLTKCGARCRRLAHGIDEKLSPLDRLHALSAAISEAVTYRTGSSEVGTTAEDALEIGAGVCQDHAHVFIACARAMGIPARYVSGYLMMNDRVAQEATHAWAEACVPDLGWVGFDVSNGISPDERYVRIATGLDYAEAAPINGFRLGAAREDLSVAVEVRQD
ncbi:transglutaminase family protein [Limimaricola hongkongensis]|uniref:Putative cysteine protease n=1 Tax=Limimaricola hongkongensis DSM 17492 TaxID=1122180 RepID=A0A017HAN2_9RHOB|nr:transglutaminase family protein [Limimaricola hongkongensis]EYD70849.1 putative cysteine protease [Limimaricola hongkongensis DSM 17492]